VYEEPVAIAADCDPSYPDLCIPPGSADLDCAYVYDQGMSQITVYPPDPHGFDGNGDGVGCEG
jgi:micrococcal nuclease